MARRRNSNRKILFKLSVPRLPGFFHRDPDFVADFPQGIHGVEFRDRDLNWVFGLMHEPKKLLGNLEAALSLTGCVIESTYQ